ncbi:hypothetical protein AGDE_13706 [Angomonas deanei]|nr:hypothetical protein AGDE_13706 [Angomonas deanei]|eukprot:EPY21912.1 hypothetical protein AGDE_13706 [Angomonas deanei]
MTAPDGENVHSTLDAFMAAKVEDPVAFATTLSTFSQRQKMEVAKVLLGNQKDEEEEADNRGVRPIASLPEEERQLLSALEAAEHIERRSSAPTHHHHSNHNDNNDVDSDLEVIDLSSYETQHTGNMTEFFQSGKTNVKTLFDNYFDGNEGEEQTELVYVPSFTAKEGTKPPSLDDFLKVESDEEEKEKEKEVPVDPTPTVPVEEEDSSTNEEDSASNSSVDLPGMEEGEPKLNPTIVFASEEFKTIREEVDDTVTTFRLDPNFDYSKDLIGKAFREHGWRETDIK